MNKTTKVCIKDELNFNATLYTYTKYLSFHSVSNVKC